MEPLSHQIGMDGFAWWVGVVEDVTDPLKVGRAKVRIFGWHTEDLSSDELPWALALAPCTHSTGVSSVKPNDWVVGFFLDGQLGQQPIIFGVLPAIPQGDGLFGKILKTAVKTYVKGTIGI
jgi:hypothetical protein